jgi:cysteine-rich CPXCG protein
VTNRTDIIGVFRYAIGKRHWKIENEAVMNTGFQCAGCGEWNQTTVDESAGRNQSYVEDCQVCCKPNVLHVQYDTGEHEFVITAQLESL